MDVIESLPPFSAITAELHRGYNGQKTPALVTEPFSAITAELHRGNPVLNG